jgi:rhodanese-related sulfurtransferase
MAGFQEVSVSQLVRRIGLPDAPVLIDVRLPDDVADDPRLIPGSRRVDHGAIEAEAARVAASSDVVVICHRGLKLSQGAAAWLRHRGIRAEVLEGGFVAWREAGAPLVRSDRIPPRDAAGRSVWVTRQRPKIDRIACPWLIRRFVDPEAVFLFVSPAEVADVAERFGATPFDVDGVFWSHRGEFCTFDVMLDEFGLRFEALDRLATIIRAADTDRLDLAPQAAGFLAASLGLSRMFRDDLAQLEAGLLLYDAMYRWCRDATAETHTWHGAAAKGAGA